MNTPLLSRFARRGRSLLRFGRDLFGRGLFDRGLFGRELFGRGLLVRGLVDRGLLGRGLFDRGLVGHDLFGRGLFGRSLFGRELFVRGLFGRGVFDRGLVARRMFACRLSAPALFALSLFAFSLASCDQQPKKPVPPDTPKALQKDEGPLTDVKVISKSSGRGDLVDAIYQELAAKDTGLTALENVLKGLSSMRSDSTEPWNDFDQKNYQYYNSAAGHITSISDSVLRKKMEMLIAESDTAYRTLAKNHRDLLARIEKQQWTLTGLHEVLKLTRTLPVIHRYQKEQMPGTAPLKHVVETYDSVMQQEDRLIKK